MLRHLSSAIAIASLCSVSTLADAARREGGVDARGNWPTERSKPPTAAEWQARMSVRMSHIHGEKAGQCDIRLIDEWLRVRCASFKTSAITQLGGARTDVKYAIEPPGADRVPGAGELIFPVRPGERRVFMFWTLGPGYDGPLTVVPAVVLQSHWLAGSMNPSITLTDALHEPVATKTHPRAPRAKDP
jgi:hypothetical protein